MKRRDTLKAISLTSLGLAALPSNETIAGPTDTPPVKIPGGRLKEEAIRDAKLKAEVFFTPHEMKTVTVLGDIILPADARSGNASQAGVPAFIEFMMKDQPQHQTPMRGGIRWLDNESVKRFGKKFVNCTKTQQIEVVEDIAYPEKVKSEHAQGAAFFSKMRDMVMTGFYTSPMGFKDLGYMGNTPNMWTGVPKDVLDKYGLAYDPKIKYADME